jgi:hypothetical protein
MQKNPIKKKDHLIFMNCGVIKFTIKRTPEKENFDV